MPGPAVSIRPSRRRSPLRQFLRKYQGPSLASARAGASFAPTCADIRMPHAERIETVAVLLEGAGELRLRLRGLAAVAARGEEIAIAALGNVHQGFGRARARDPDRRMRPLGRPRPRIDVAQRVVTAFPGEWSVPRSRHYE